MPTIIDYPHVLARFTAAGLVCNYHNSGAFAFPPGADVQYAGLIGPPDDTIKPAALAWASVVPEPHAPTLARVAADVWAGVLGGGPVWVMPMSHWAFELEFGSAGWLPEVLASMGIDAADLGRRNDASAVEFAPGESAAMVTLLENLLTRLGDSDFMLAFPAAPALCMVHHHTQLWWMTLDAGVRAAIAARGGGGALSGPPASL